MAVCTAKLLFYFCIVPAHLSAGQTNASHCLKTSLMTAADLQAHLKKSKASLCSNEEISDLCLLLL